MGWSGGFGVDKGRREEDVGEWFVCERRRRSASIVDGVWSRKYVKVKRFWRLRFRV